MVPIETLSSENGKMYHNKLFSGRFQMETPSLAAFTLTLKKVIKVMSLY